MDSLGDFRHAAQVFSTLLDYVWEPSARLLVSANLARAAAGAGWRDTFEAMWIEVWLQVRQQTTRIGHAAALLQVAMGAGSLADWTRAEIAATEGLAVAREREEAEMVLRHEAVLAALSSEVIADDTLLTVFKDTQHTTSEHSVPGAADLVAEFGNAMRARRDGAPESPTRALVT